MTNEVDKPQARKRYSAEFKAEALKLCEQVGVSAASRELGVATSQLYDWRTKARAEQSQGAADSAQAREITRLKRELADKEEELAILKKATAYFARSLK